MSQKQLRGHLVPSTRVADHGVTSNSCMSTLSFDSPCGAEGYWASTSDSNFHFLRAAAQCFLSFFLARDIPNSGGKQQNMKPPINYRHHAVGLRRFILECPLHNGMRLRDDSRPAVGQQRGREVNHPDS